MVCVLLDRRDLIRLDAAAKAHRQTRSGLIRLALDRFIERKEGVA